MKNIDHKKRVLLNNTIMLYIMTFSIQLFNLATIPYLTRVFGAAVYGKIGLALSYMAYLQIIMDFGFILSATRKVAEHRDDRRYLSSLFTAVTITKIVLGLTVCILFMAYVRINDNMRDDWGFYALYTLSFLVYALVPDFLYRGFENMKIITYRTVAIKALFMVLVFVFVHDKSQYRIIPLFNLIGNILAVAIMYADIGKRYSINLCRINMQDIYHHVKDSAPFFISRASGTAYQAANTIVLNFIYGNSAVVGFYTASDKLVSLVKSGSSPVADSLFPYMVKNKNFRLIKKILMIAMPIMILALTVCAVFADEICVILFGAEYRDAGRILRLLLPYILIIFPTYILAFPVMVPMGLTKYANLSNVFGLALQVLMLSGFAIFNILSVYTLCVATSVTEVSVFMFRLFFVLKYKDRLKTRQVA